MSEADEDTDWSDAGSFIDGDETEAIMSGISDSEMEGINYCACHLLFNFFETYLGNRERKKL